MSIIDLKSLVSLKSLSNYVGEVVSLNENKTRARVKWNGYKRHSSVLVRNLQLLPDKNSVQETKKLSPKEIEDKVNDKFSAMTSLVEGVVLRKLNGLLIHGEGGIGKTHTIISALEKCGLNDNKFFFKRFSGHITPLQLFITLEKFNSKDTVLLFDDCDAVFMDQTSLNIMKAAMDTTKKRSVAWQSSMNTANTDSFDFEGNIIVITNSAIPKNMHTKAFFDRIHNFLLRLSPEERIVRINQISKAIADDTNVTEETRSVLVQWLIEHVSDAENLTLRTFLKLCNLAAYSPDWQRLARLTILNHM